MGSWLRPFYVIFLCSLVGIGQIPAWVHVSCCTVELENPAAEVESGCNANCCAHHHGTASDSADEGNVPSDHDPDDCLICQSLATPCGEVVHQDLPAVKPMVMACLLTPTVFFVDEVPRTIHLRGPPQVL